MKEIPKAIFRFRDGLKQVRGLFPITVLVCLSSCATPNDLERLSREQAATIESLNHEIQRLNEELDQAILSSEELQGAQRELEQRLREELQAGDLTVGLESRGLVVSLLDRILFDSGKTELKETAKMTLDKVVDVLQERLSDHHVYVEGHTDNTPIRYSGWRSNWELSASRATEVIHYFVDQRNMWPQRLAAVGYGEFRPVAANDSEEGRMQNRRVEIVITPLKTA